MKKFMLAAATFTALAFISAPAAASVTIQGDPAGTTVNGYSGSNGLDVSGSGLSYGPFTLANIGSTFTVDVLTIGTTASSAILSGPAQQVSVDFSFLNPADANGGLVTGSTTGFVSGLFGGCGLFAGGCGYVDWSNAPTIFNFGNGGSFSLVLSDATFGTPGNARVSGTFTLLSNSVPEPATWAMMLMGFGAVGFAMRRRRSSAGQLAQLA